ncbi:MAG: hypothetical protein SFV23_23080 [Planctomycetaceae bacterium]|nr:hypothetical protein [Planctomycetaceae bacterium]
MPVVTGKAVGRKKPLFADWSWPLVPASDGDEGLTLRKLIDSIVREQVAAFRSRQADDQMLRVLTAPQIASAAERGKIALGQSEVGLQEVDVDAAVGAALQAFEDGLYLVVIDEVQRKCLDEQVFLEEDSRITFLRLTLLAGG